MVLDKINFTLIMLTISKEEMRERTDEFYDKIRKGNLFIYPTDTIYGIGCDASNEQAVNNLRTAKARPTTPFSVIVPSTDWIRENCHIPKHAEPWLDKLPGPYTLILKLKNQDGIAKNVNPGISSIGIRIPNHWISGVVRELNTPIITTSANKAGSEFMTSTENLDPKVASKVDFTIAEGEKEGNPSTLIDLTESETKVIERQ
mgnify:CR=1 FL=1|jgi:L-threonylcarbamoyladenylate synthase